MTISKTMITKKIVTIIMVEINIIFLLTLKSYYHHQYYKYDLISYGHLTVIRMIRIISLVT